MKQLVAFDLDGTLAASKQPIDPSMAEALTALLTVTQVAIISGGDWPQFEKQVIAKLGPGTRFENLWILPTTGAKLFRFTNGRYSAVYQESFPAQEKAEILLAIDAAIKSVGLQDTRIWGKQVEDRGSQLTFSGLGQQAPLDAKMAWDPDFKKRKALQVILRQALPNLSVNVGGSTSIDITKKGVDKGYGLRRLAEVAGLPLSAILFVGDAIYPGGNDYPAKEAGVDTIAVRDVPETLTVIAAITAWASRRDAQEDGPDGSAEQMLPSVQVGGLSPA